MERNVKRCIVCGYTWIAKVEMPILCPRCRSYRWYRPPKKYNPYLRRPTEDEIRKAKEKQIIDEDVIIEEG